ncbi:hypothetical protein BCY86_07580 [Pajaroellobacter abortibovis]|uniref:Uncharacterized protein n=1 Tax=Pajaroellobacter abortibovis TaxID=1882918 RepID=A0A1L6MYG7_9BACT|nr:hypothetical protein BCY86_07580 [Pajaroellobacter abortibovis]
MITLGQPVYFTLQRGAIISSFLFFSVFQALTFHVDDPDKVLALHAENAHQPSKSKKLLVSVHPTDFYG